MYKGVMIQFCTITCNFKGYSVNISHHPILLVTWSGGNIFINGPNFSFYTVL